MEPAPKSSRDQQENIALKPIKNLLVATLCIAIIGFLDATYLTVKHYVGSPVSCSVSFFNKCSEVTSSVYSVVMGLPVALFGAFFYLLVIVLSILYLDLKRTIFAKLVAGLSVAGFMMSGYFIFVQAVELKSFCLYCLVSALSSTLIFIISLFIYNRIEYKAWSMKKNMRK